MKTVEIIRPSLAVARAGYPPRGVELQYGDRTNFRDGFDTNIFKVQFSFKYNFSHTFYRN